MELDDEQGDRDGEDAVAERLQPDGRDEVVGVADGHILRSKPALGTTRPGRTIVGETAMQARRGGPGETAEDSLSRAAQPPVFGAADEQDLPGSRPRGVLADASGVGPEKVAEG